MSDSRADQAVVDYRCYNWGEVIYAGKEDLQSFGIGIGLAFPGELNGPKRQLTVRDPRGFRVKVTKSYCASRPFLASIRYPHVPDRPASPETTAFSGVRMQEGPWTDDFIGRAECLIAAGLVTAAQLPGAPGMRKTRVTILADGSILKGNYSNSMPGGAAAGIRHIERASARSAMFTVRVHIGSVERDRRELRRAIAESAWQHEARKAPRPRQLEPRYGAAVVKHAKAAATARSDATFQALLGKLIQLPAGEES